MALDPASLVVVSGGVLELDLTLDAADAPGTSPGAIQGGVLLSFDADALTFTGFDFAAPAIVTDDVTEGPGGTVSLGFAKAADVGVVGTYRFTVNALPGDVISLAIADVDDFFGTFLNEDPSNLPFTPTFEGATVTVVPVPAAAWFCLSGLGFLAATARRRAA